ncbi:MULTISPECIES: hypothetical protein [unclassified Microcoleus]
MLDRLHNNVEVLALLNQGVQSDRVNVWVAAEVADYLYRMAAGNLKRFV